MIDFERLAADEEMMRAWALYVCQFDLKRSMENVLRALEHYRRRAHAAEKELTKPLVKL